MIKHTLGSFLKDGTFVPAPSTEVLNKALASSLAGSLRFTKESLSSPSPAPFPPGGTQPPVFQHGAGTLSYGGTPAKTPYKVGSKPAASITFKKQKRNELIARMENAALPEAQIATLLGLTVGRLRALKQHPDYLAARMKVTLGIIIDTDASLDQIREQRKELLKSLLPPALQVIANAVQTPAVSYAEKKLQISVAQDILDREGTFAKISRSEVKPVEHFDWETADAAAENALDVVKGTIKLTQEQSRALSGLEGAEGREKIEKIIEITRRFSTSSPLSQIDQQEALKDLEKHA